MDSDDHIDIRRRLRAHAARQARIARLAAPQDWQDELRRAIVRTRAASPLLARNSDIRLFAESFAIFFTAAMVFLI